MIDKEKVLKGLECCAAMGDYECQECPYRHECLDNDLPYGMSHLAADALALLKEQKPVKVVVDGEDFYMCNNCGMVVGWVELDSGGTVEMKSKFCPECGREVKWE